jgi:hypothetical protein
VAFCFGDGSNVAVYVHAECPLAEAAHLAAGLRFGPGALAKPDWEEHIALLWLVRAGEGGGGGKEL